ncbi:MAG: hypothetical protein ABIN25_13790 [Ginsengibacter sp.]
MKRLALAFGVLSLAVFTLFMGKEKKRKKTKKGKKFLAVEMDGPHGEPILNDGKGGKYYMKGNKKVSLRKVK